jgi:hypothetical protein
MPGFSVLCSISISSNKVYCAEKEIHKDLIKTQL